MVFTLCVILLTLPLLVAPKNWRISKTSSYECGFEPFFGTKQEDLHFVAIGIAYIIFDVELLLLGPEILIPHAEGTSTLILVSLTGIIVVIGTVLEIVYGALY